ncbi:MAG: hypothetical protein MMC23_003322 [Stictis urceolatum]|nr:hypothetical protein [Stictis urceolata]
MPLSTTSTPTTTLLFLTVFILAFFPPIFQSIITLPLYLPSLLYPSSPPPIAAQPQPPAPTMSWFQKQFTLPSRSRGSYLITDHIESSLPEISQYKVGILHLFVLHTSCGLTMNENWDEEVREDMSDALDRLAPQDKAGKLYRHAAEGLDDMPAHIKSSLVGSSVTVPITDGKLTTGTWQGIWYLEFRQARHSRKVVATIQGEKK